jgi:hypothetical protein
LKNLWTVEMGTLVRVLAPCFNDTPAGPVEERPMMTRSTLMVLVAGLSTGLACSAHAQDGVLTGRLPDGVPNTAPAADPNAPKVTFDKMNHEFGKISDEKAVETSFMFKNEGKQKLVLTQPHGSCGCTVPSLTKLEYEPGEEGVIKVVFNPAGKHGEQNTRVSFSTNDPAQKDIALAIHSIVRQTVWFEPPLVSFGEVELGKTPKQVVKVNGPAPDFKVTYVSSTKGRIFDVKVLDTKEVEVDGEKVSQSTVEVTFNGKAPRGTVQAMATARTTLPTHALADFQIMAEVVGDVQVLPARVSIGMLEADSKWERTIKVKSRSQSAFKITKVDQQSNLPEGFTADFKPDEGSNDSSYTVTLHGQHPSNPMSINGKLMISTNLEADPVIEVPLSGVVRPKGTEAPKLDRSSGPTTFTPPKGDPHATPIPQPAQPAAPAPQPAPAGQPK